MPYNAAFFFHFLSPVGRAWSEETALQRWNGKSDRQCYVVYLRDCTAAPAGTDSLAIKHEIASELHPQSDQTSKGFGCCGQVLLVTNVKPFVLLTLILEGENAVAGGYF